MPIESAQYIDTLQPDWPLGTDPESAGDDHIRQIKKVLQNTFPTLDSPLTTTPQQINDVTYHVAYTPGDGTVNGPAQVLTTDQNPDGAVNIPFSAATPAVSVLQANTKMVLNWECIQTLFYPVGSVIMNSTGVNPANYLGFGTWTQRTGTMYGVGDAADQNGYVKTITPGAHNADAFWRVQTGHIVAADLSVSLTMNPVDDHAHNVATSHIETSGQNPSTISVGSYDGVAGYEMSEPAGAHTPSGTGAVTVGVGGVADSSQFMTPGYAFYFWERTA
ncbi:MAG: hypothetical protein RR068_02340 [Hafnia sp.]